LNIFDWSLGLSAKQSESIIQVVEAGLKADVVERLKARLGLCTEELADLLRVSTRTLARRQRQGRLAVGESDLLYRFARLYEQAVEVMGNEADALLWLKQPQWGLGGAVPLDYARTEPGVREVEDLLDRIAYGVFM
jgi:putative toxin-antitoxin system antitoxin component (TIGR02293 family)